MWDGKKSESCSFPAERQRNDKRREVLATDALSNWKERIKHGFDDALHGNRTARVFLSVLFFRAV